MFLHSQLMNIWIISSLGLLGTKPMYVFLYRSLDGFKEFIPLEQILGVRKTEKK